MARKDRPNDPSRNTRTTSPAGSTSDIRATDRLIDRITREHDTEEERYQALFRELGRKK